MSYFKENYPENLALDSIPIPCPVQIYIRSRNSNYLGLPPIREISIQGRIDASSRKDLDQQISQLSKIKINQPISLLSQEANQLGIYFVSMTSYPQFYPIPLFEYSRFLRIHLIEKQSTPNPIPISSSTKSNHPKNVISIRLKKNCSVYHLSKIFYLDFKLIPLIQFLNPDPNSLIKYLPIAPTTSTNHTFLYGQSFHSLSKLYYLIHDYHYLIRKHNPNFTWINQSSIYIPPLISSHSPIFSSKEYQGAL